MLKDHKHHYKGGACVECGRPSRRGWAVRAIVPTLAAATIVGAACAPPPQIGTPALQRAGLSSPVLPMWSRSGMEPIFLAPGAKPWCGGYAKVAYQYPQDPIVPMPCDAGSYTDPATDTVTRTRLDVDLSNTSRGKDADAGVTDFLRAECDDAGSELIVHVDGNNVIAAAECEDVDY